MSTAETIGKLQPDRDLQCYFLRPSAIAALSATSPTGLTISGSWRQQFDWTVLEWSRDNTFEHPALRNLPDGDLSGLTLSYVDSRVNCIPLDSNLYPTVDWPFLRLWLDLPGGEVLRYVRLHDLAQPSGSFQAATATFDLVGECVTGDFYEIAVDPFSTAHFNYTAQDGDTLAKVAAHLVSAMASSPDVAGVSTGSTITLTLKNVALGSNGNRVGAYGSTFGSNRASWSPAAQEFGGGQSPSEWTVTVPFGNLHGSATQNPYVPELLDTTSIRKMRWTYAADLQPTSYQRSEFQVTLRNWSVTGQNRLYRFSGSGSRRIEDDAADLTYLGAWTPPVAAKGNFSQATKVAGPNPPQNFSGGSIAWSTERGSSISFSYSEPSNHDLYLGTRLTNVGAIVQATVDSNTQQINSRIDPGVDYVDSLARVHLGTFTAGTHSVSLQHAGAEGSYFYFDFIEISHASTDLPDFTSDGVVTLATDWDTDHSIALSPERTAWMIDKLGFRGRANHYVGALWFPELTRIGHIYSTAVVTFSGISNFGDQSTIVLDGTTIVHVHLTADTPGTVAKAFELQINNGSTSVWASAISNDLTLTSRKMGLAGNGTSLSASTARTGASTFGASVSSAPFTNGYDGTPSGVAYQDGAGEGWRTDLASTPRLNRAVRDWTRSYFTALADRGITASCAFSTELQFVDPSSAVGIAQRYPSNGPVVLNTPAIQTNFSPTSLAYWKDVYLSAAQLMVDAGQIPYLQFGELQWWYFADDQSGLPFYDDYTKQQFMALHGRPLPVITSPSQSPSALTEETGFLASQIGQFSGAIMDYVLGALPQTRFEVLYPPDVNNTPLMGLVNYPKSNWTAQTLSCLKTENFTFTGNRNLDQALVSILLPIVNGFPASKSAHLIGIGDYSTPWVKETGLTFAQNVESIVLFALDQFSLIGYQPDFYKNIRRSLSMA